MFYLLLVQVKFSPIKCNRLLHLLHPLSSDTIANSKNLRNKKEILSLVKNHAFASAWKDALHLLLPSALLVAKTRYEVLD